MRKSEELGQEFAKTNPDRRQGSQEEKDRYKRDKIMLELMMDVRDRLSTLVDLETYRQKREAVAKKDMGFFGEE